MIQRAVAGVAICAGVVALGACSSTESNGDEPSVAPVSSGPPLAGEPIKLLQMTATTGPGARPEDKEAAEATELAINNTGGLAGRPVQIDTCEEGFDPNLAAACGRRAIDEGYLAVIGESSALSESYLPLLSAAGIPSVGSTTAGPSDATDPMSFPISAAIPHLIGEVAVLGGKDDTNARMVAAEIPAAVGLVELVKQLGPTMGVNVEGSTLVPISGATDYSQYAQQAYGSKADGIVGALLGTQIEPFLKAAIAQGVDFNEKTTVLAGATFDPDLLDGSLKNQLDGVYIVNYGYDIADTGNADIAEFQSYLKAVGAKNKPTQIALQTWATGDLLKTVIDKDPAAADSPQALAKALQATGPVTPSAWVPVDFTKPAMEGTPLAAQFPRYATTQGIVYKIVDNKPVQVTPGPVSLLAPIKVSQ